MHQTSFYCTLESHLNAHFIYLILLSLVFEVKIKEYLNKFEKLDFASFGLLIHDSVQCLRKKQIKYLVKFH
jgi:hypothetical protein